jgi:hypothetical protein
MDLITGMLRCNGSFWLIRAVLVRAAAIDLGVESLLEERTQKRGLDAHPQKANR